MDSSWVDMTPEERVRHKRHCDKWRRENPEKVRAIRKEYYLKHPGMLLQSARKYARRNRESINAYRWMGHLWRKYGMGVDGYHSLVERFGERCHCCRNIIAPRGQFVHVDHDHETGRVRGLVCHSCNMMIGYAKDSQKVLSCGVAYLDRSQRLKP